MHRFPIFLFFLLIASAAIADQPSPIDSTQAQPRVSMRSYPPLDKIFARANRYGHRISTSVTVAYDQDGNVLTVKLDEPTGDRSLDKAILAWAAMVKIQADGPGSGKLPIKVGFGG